MYIFITYILDYLYCSVTASPSSFRSSPQRGLQERKHHEKCRQSQIRLQLSPAEDFSQTVQATRGHLRKSGDLIGCAVSCMFLFICFTLLPHITLCRVSSGYHADDNVYFPDLNISWSHISYNKWRRERHFKVRTCFGCCTGVLAVPPKNPKFIPSRFS